MMNQHRPLLLAVLCLTLTGAEHEKPLMRDFMGINGHFHFKPALYRPTCRLARNYHNINWDVKAPGDAITIPTCVNKVDWDRNVYGAWAAGGFENDLCAMFGSFGEGSEGYIGLWAGKGQWAHDYGAALATHFGSSGTGSVSSIEIGNEPGADFDEATYQLVFRNMAAGIREADPQMKIVTCTAHARRADNYSKDLRESFADAAVLPLYDVINVHTYAQLPKKDGRSPWTRAYPESDESPYMTVVDEVVAWRDSAAPGKEIWVTEFGYDACTEQAMQRRTGWFKKLDWQGVSDLQQAQYLVRSFMLFAERPVDRAYIYFFNDDDAPQVHGCAGLTRKFEPKPAYHAVAQLHSLLGDFRFTQVLRQDSTAYVYAFENPDTGKQIWVAWSPTGVITDRKAGHQERRSDIELKRLPARVTTVHGMATGASPAPQPPFTQRRGRLSLTVGESPCYIVFE